MKVALLALALGLVQFPVHAADAANAAQLDRLETQVVRAEDLRAIKKLQRAYGYYADRGLWDDLGDLFAEDAVANYPSGGFDGNASIRAMFVQNLGQGKAGLAEGRIYNHTILQPWWISRPMAQRPRAAGGYWACWAASVVRPPGRIRCTASTT